MRLRILLLTATLLFASAPPGIQAKSIEKQLASLSQDLSNPSRSLEARLRMAQLLEGLGATRAYPEQAARPSSGTYYFALLRDNRTGDSELLPEVLDGWERTLQLEIASPHKITPLKAWVKNGTSVFASESDNSKYEKTTLPNLWHVFDIANGRVLLRRQSPGVVAAWVQLAGVELRVEEVRRHPASTLSQFGRYLDAPPTDCCLEELEEIGRIRDDIAYAHYSSDSYMERFPNGRHVEEAIAAKERGIFLEAGSEITEAGKKAGYRMYLQLYPTGTHAKEAKRELREMELAAFNAAKQSNQQGVYREYLYREYLQEYPEGEYADVARREIEKLRLLGRCERGNQEKCQEFLRQFPESEQRTAIEKRIEDSAYQAALEVGTVAGYRIFLNSHPSGSQSGQARKELRKLEAGQAFATASTEDELWRVSKDYPETEEGKTARKRAERLGFQRAKAVGDLGALSEYLGRYRGASYQHTRWISSRRNYHLASSSGSYETLRDFLKPKLSDLNSKNPPPAVVNC